MDIWASLNKLIGGGYQYRAGPNTLGIGVENLALEQPGRTVDQDFWSARYNVRRSISPRFDTFPNTGQYLPSYDLRASGVYLSGEVQLNGVIENLNLGGAAYG